MKIGDYLKDNRACGLRIYAANDMLHSRSQFSSISGYYGDEHGDETMQPIVARLTHSRGFLYGWTLGDGMATTLATEVVKDAEDAARWAHNMAERDAETERDYQAEGCYG